MVRGAEMSYLTMNKLLKFTMAFRRCCPRDAGKHTFLGERWFRRTPVDEQSSVSSIELLSIPTKRHRQEPPESTYLEFHL